MSNLLMYSMTLVLSALMAVRIKRFCRFLKIERFEKLERQSPVTGEMIVVKRRRAASVKYLLAVMDI